MYNLALIPLLGFAGALAIECAAEYGKLKFLSLERQRSYTVYVHVRELSYTKLTCDSMNFHKKVKAESNRPYG